MNPTSINTGIHHLEFATVNGRTMLTLDSAIQFVEGPDERTYHAYLTAPLREIDFTRVLILGGGDGLAARDVLQINPDAKITLVEIDPGVVNFAMTNREMLRLNLNSLANCHILFMDAFDFVMKLPVRVTFDAVLLDLTDPKSATDLRMYTKAYLEKVKGILRPGGAISVQATMSEQFADQVAANLRDVFGNAYSLHYGIAESDGALVHAFAR
jgi:spermidine synthase